MPGTTRRQFTDEFKSEAVRLTRESGRPVAQVARDLGISDNVLYRWRTEQRQVESQGRTRQEARDQIRDAIELYVQSLREHGDAVPPGLDEEVIEVPAA